MPPITTGLASTLFLDDIATTVIYTLSLHDALPISTSSTDGPAAGEARHRRLRPHRIARAPARSEERRVGKECRTQTAPYQQQHGSSQSVSSNRPGVSVRPVSSSTSR